MAAQRGCRPLGRLQEPRAGIGPVCIHSRKQEPAASAWICCSVAPGPFPFHPSWPTVPFPMFPTSMCFSLDFTCN